MSPIEIATIIIAIAFVLLVIGAIPTLLAIKRTAKSVAILVDTLHNDLQPAIADLTGLLADMKTTSGKIADRSEDVTRLMVAMGETGTNLSNINRALGIATRVINTTSIWATGAKVAGTYMLEQYLIKRGGK